MDFSHFKIKLHRKANKTFTKLPDKVKANIEEAFETMLQNPYRHANIKKMRGFESTYRYRLGGYRIIYKMEEEAIILILVIGKRGDVYK